jgi:type I restriction enzyme M protein
MSEIQMSEQINFIWSIANTLRGTYIAQDYKKVIIPMTIIRRFECVLEKTKDLVLEKSKETTNFLKLCDASGQTFYNVSPFTLKKIGDDEPNCKANFLAYIDSFSPNVKDILEEKLKFKTEIDTLDDNDKLYSIIKSFSNVDLSVSKVSNIQMGYIFEDLIRRFSENAEAGDHYTPREVIHCLAKILLAEGCDDLYEEGKIVTVGDFACGTGGMLSETYNIIKGFNSSADIEMFGQDINDEALAMCMADMLIKGQNPEHIKKQDTLQGDAFPNQKFRLIIMNPPFGTSWSKKDNPKGNEQVLKDNVSETGRFHAGLPGTNDAQVLFLMHALSKLNETNGRAAIISNASPLFSDQAGTNNQSHIRKWLLDNDYVEAIIQLPDQLFYNTGITIYAWILSKHKRTERKNKIALIDASSFWTPMRKSLGNKRKFIDDTKGSDGESQQDQIVRLYSEFDSKNEHVRILTKEDLFYKIVTSEQPYQRNFIISEKRIANIWQQSAFGKLSDEDRLFQFSIEGSLSKGEAEERDKLLAGQKLQNDIIAKLKTLVSEKVWDDKEEFLDFIEEKLPNLSISLYKNIVDALSDTDSTSKTYKKRDGSTEPDPALRDYEKIPFLENIETYFSEEVYPFVPKAWPVWKDDFLSLEKNVGCEINFNKYFFTYVEPKKASDYLREFREAEVEETKLSKALKS